MPASSAFYVKSTQKRLSRSWRARFWLIQRLAGRSTVIMNANITPARTVQCEQRALISGIVANCGYLDNEPGFQFGGRKPLPTSVRKFPWPTRSQ